jgi:hypothetical protein
VRCVCAFFGSCIFLSIVRNGQLIYAPEFSLLDSWSRSYARLATNVFEVDAAADLDTH